MSVHVMSWVLNNSPSRLADRLVLLVLADHAHADGTEARPSIPTIAAEARMTERHVQRCLKNLRDAGEIVRTGKDEHGATVYSIPLAPDKLSPPTNCHPPDKTGVSTPDKLSPEPSTKRTVEEDSAKALSEKSSSTAASERRIFDYAVEQLGHPRWKFTADRRRVIRARLNDGYSEQELLSVIDGVLRDPWDQRRLNGNDDLTKVLRSGSQADKFIELVAAGVNGNGSALRPGDDGFLPSGLVEEIAHKAMLRKRNGGSA